jgi:hypothetical protein
MKKRNENPRIRVEPERDKGKKVIGINSAATAEVRSSGL